MTRRLSTAVLALAMAASLSGCFGKWALTRRVYAWNQSISDKFMRSIATWIIGPLVPVYSIAIFVDFVVFNTVEFWTGSNPVETGRMTSAVSGETTLTAARATENGADVLVFERHVAGRYDGRVVVTRLDGDAVEARSFAADGTLERTGRFAMRDVSAERLTELQFDR